MSPPVQAHRSPQVPRARTDSVPHFYDGYHFFGMHLLWWLFWLAFIGIIFGPYQPFRRSRER